MTEIEENIKQCKKRKKEYKRMIKNIDLLRLSFERSIAVEDINIERLKQMEGEENEQSI